jgi:hypothetical protein
MHDFERGFSQIHIMSHRDKVIELLGMPKVDNEDGFYYCSDDGVQRTEITIKFSSSGTNVIEATSKKTPNPYAAE